MAVAGCATVDLQATRNNTSCTGALVEEDATHIGLTPITPDVVSKGDPGPIKKEYFEAGGKRLRGPGMLLSSHLFGTEADLAVLTKDVTGNAADIQAAQDARNQIQETLKGVPASAGSFLANPAQPQMNLGSIDRMQATRLSKIGRTLGVGGYSALVVASLGQLQTASTPEQQRYLVQEFNTALFLAKYFAAYFRDGHFLQVSVNSSALLDKATQDIKNKLSGLQLTQQQQAAITNALGDLEKQVQTGLCTNPDSSSTCLLTQPLGTTAFVTRAGTSIQFSGVSVSIGDNGKLSPTATHLSSTVIAPQLAEVFWEAVFDSLPPYVPAAANSTACVKGLYPSPSELCMTTTTSAADKDKIDTVDSDATKAQSAATAAASYIIRGGWLFSLNNEAVAQAVETSVGEIARKATEKLVWSELTKCAGRVQSIVSTSKDY